MKKISAILAIATTTLIGCGKSIEKDIIGKWDSEFAILEEDRDDSSRMNVNCVSEYFANKGSNHECTFKFDEDTTDGLLILNARGKLKMSGEWNFSEQTLLEKTVDAKFEITDLRIGGMKIDEKERKAYEKEYMRDHFIKGETSASKTLYFDGKMWISQNDDGKKLITVTAIRRQSNE